MRQKSESPSDNSFAWVLTELRTGAGLTQQALADEMGLSRGYVSLLESVNEGKKPSVDMLAKLCRVLEINDLSNPGHRRKFWRLMTSCLNIEASGDPFTDAIGGFDDELRCQQLQSINELWIISDLLAENHVVGFLHQTAENLRAGVRYVFFVPQGSGEDEWRTCLDRLVSEEKLELQSLPADRLLAIASPATTCVPSVRLSNPGLRTADGVVSVGQGITDLLLYRIPRRQVDELFTRLRPVVNNLAVQNTEQAYVRLYPN